MSDHLQAYTPARLRGIADWFREFANMGSAAERGSWLDLATFYYQLAEERETQQKSRHTESVSYAVNK